jgi:hypothetical protein
LPLRSGCRVAGQTLGFTSSTGALAILPWAWRGCLETNNGVTAALRVGAWRR